MRAATRGLAAVSIDLDGARHYHAVHGLPPPRRDELVVRGLERYLALCQAHKLRSTVFVITQDLKDDALRALVRRAHEEGHEIASHSHAHRYDLSRQAPAFIEADLARSVDALTALTGTRPRGFRAPGYNQSEALMDAIEKLGFSYDSSFLASPLYFGARALAISAIRARSLVSGGPRSISIVGDVRETLPRAPFRPRRLDRTQPARSRVDGRAFLEVPIAGALGAPFIGAALLLAGHFHRALTAAVLWDPSPCVLELHAIDLCGPDDVDAALRRAQPDARVSLERKTAVLGATFSKLMAARRVVPLAEIVADGG
jgi:peptidoglycan-N-acetylglucosamine deacetylase